jgi:transposase
MTTSSLHLSTLVLSSFETGVSPFDQRTVQITKKDHVELKWQASFWKTQHKRVAAREEILKEQLKQKDAKISNLKQHLDNKKGKKAEIANWQTRHKKAIAQVEVLKEQLKQKEAIIRDLNQRLYGKKSEKSRDKGNINPDAKGNLSKRPRGRQKGSLSHGRTVRSTLPIIHEVIPLSETACGVCGLNYSLLSSHEESDIIEVEVTAHTRRIKRQKCVTNCTCTPGSKLITAPTVPKLIPKSPYGNSIWAELLIKKFLHAQPINRTLNDFKSLGLTIAPGTIAGGLKKLTPLFEPVYKAFHQQQMTENRFHNDETRWEVYQQIEGKVGHRWYLWLTRSISVVYYRMDPTRSADVPLSHFADLVSKIVIIICDRYSAYKKLARLNLSIILAFCWAHVRRDFLDFSRSHVDMKGWGLDWAAEISKLFHLNNQRIALWDPSLPITHQSSLFQESHNVLGCALRDMKARCDALLHEDKIAQDKNGKKQGTLTVAQRKVLTSLADHWKGLTVFYDRPEVKMDNNPAEQSMRNPVLGRNGYYGSGSLWSAELAAMMFSIFQTLLLWNLNPRTWLNLYFKICAQNGGKAPDDLSDFLPWTMSKARLQQFSKPPDNNTS